MSVERSGKESGSGRTLGWRCTGGSGRRSLPKASPQDRENPTPSTGQGRGSIWEKQSVRGTTPDPAKGRNVQVETPGRGARGLAEGPGTATAEGPVSTQTPLSRQPRASPSQSTSPFRSSEQTGGPPHHLRVALHLTLSHQHALHPETPGERLPGKRSVMSIHFHLKTVFPHGLWDIAAGWQLTLTPKTNLRAEPFRVPGRPKPSCKRTATGPHAIASWKGKELISSIWRITSI